MSDDVRLLLGDCTERMAEIASASVDAIITDPPYPEIDRPYGRMTEAEWWELMMGVCREARRVLTPTGSAVFILQPNSRKVGSMRGWLWRFMGWACDEWNMVQDFWWWNFSMMPLGGAMSAGLGRPSVKACVWLGPSGCHRDQEAVLWGEADRTKAMKLAQRAGKQMHRKRSPCGHTMDDARIGAAADRRGGVTPFNLLPMPNADPYSSGGSYGHGAATPHELCDWWVRYIAPQSGLVCDPFMGSGTTGLAALKRGRRFVGIERDEDYFNVAHARIAEYRASTPLLEGLAS